VHDRCAIFIQLPFQDQKVRFDRCRVGKHGCQLVVERAQAFESTRGTVPRIIERGRVIVFIDDVVQDGVGVVYDVWPQPAPRSPRTKMRRRAAGTSLAHPSGKRHDVA